MADPVIPTWLKTLPLAPEYRPTETEFSDPIAFISRIEREAAAFGICKVIPPLPKPSKRFVLANLNRSLAKSPELGPSAAAVPSPEAAVFTTRHQEVGSRRSRTSPVHKQVWQSGEVYTLEQFEAKSKAFSRSQLGGFKEVRPLLVESLFWRAATEKPIYVEYANDVPGSGFGVPEDSFRYYAQCRKRKRRFDRGKIDGPKSPYPEASGDGGQQKVSGSGGEMEGSAGWRLSNSHWNLQVIARSPGSLTRFMPDEVPGVTSPMVYIGMLFSWFAWHVEDHELHSMNFLHMGSPKTWYAIPGEYASTVEEIVRVQGYGGNADRLAAFTMLGEKTTLLSPEVFVASGVPCCRLVQHPGEFVVTFPRAYHVGFSHGFNCGEAANFATSQWLKVAKDAAVRRAAMNCLPMLSHQQLLYMLTMSFISRVPRALLPGVRSSRLKDRKREEREIIVKKAFLNDMMHENRLLCALLAKESTFYAVLWEPELLPSPCSGSQAFSSSSSLEAHGSVVDDGHGRETMHSNLKDKTSFNCRTDKFCVENALHGVASNLSSVSCNNLSSIETQKSACHIDRTSLNWETLEDIDVSEDELPFGLNVDSGSLTCVSCGILGYPFMAIIQPSERASKVLFPVNSEEIHQKAEKSDCSNLSSCLPRTVREMNTDDFKEASIKFVAQGNQDSSCMLSPALSDFLTEGPSARYSFNLLNMDFKESSSEMTLGKVSKTIPGHQVESISSRMPHSIGNLTTDNMLINSVNDDGYGHISRLVEHHLDQFNPLNEADRFAPNKGTKIDCSNLLHPCDQLKEFKGSTHPKDNAIAENDSSTTHLSGIRPMIKTDRQLCAPVGKSGKEINKKWDTSNRFVRPRIFCLQHALEIEELLQCKGGANVLIICHSDYVKIKAHTFSIAEEISTKFSCKDVPLENASAQDLDLLNISIDDEEHDEHGDDWTSKLGLNLRYCLKLRKQSSPNQQPLTLALGGLFSDRFPVSVVSSLKWCSRKSRTPYKVTGVVQSKRTSDANIEKSVPVMRKSIADSTKRIQVYHSRKSGLNGMSKKNLDLPRNSTAKELCSSMETGTLDVKDFHRSTSGHVNLLNNEVENNNTDSLLTIPILFAQNPLMHKDGRAMEKINIPHDVDLVKSQDLAAPANSTVDACKMPIEIQPTNLNNVATVCDPVKSRCHQPCTIVEGSEMRHVIHTAEERSKNSKVDCSEKSEFQADTVIDESNSAHEFDKTVDSAYESSARKTVDSSEDLHEVPVAWAPNFRGSFRNCMFSDDQSFVPVLSSSNFEMQLEVSVAAELKMKNIQEKVSVAMENSMQLEMQQELHRSSEMGASSKGNSSEMPQELICAIEMEDSSKVCDSVKSSDHPVVEVNPNLTADDSVKPAPTVTVPVTETPMHINSTGVTDRALKNCGEKDNGKSTIVEYKSYVRRNKRKREAGQIVADRHSCSGFIRSPCEGLRPRSGRTTYETVQTTTVDMKVTVKATKRGDGSADQQGKAKSKASYKGDHSSGRRRKDKGKGPNGCDLGGCRLSFGTREELLLHKRSRCTYRGCRKRSGLLQRATRDQHANDDRPLKCPWKGCEMSFKWAWARTEHIRVHTGERPYRCKVAGCGLTFRFISDFSRHRRKTGHSVKS